MTAHSAADALATTVIVASCSGSGVRRGTSCSLLARDGTPMAERLEADTILTDGMRASVEDVVPENAGARRVFGVSQTFCPNALSAAITADRVFYSAREWARV